MNFFNKGRQYDDWNEQLSIMQRLTSWVKWKISMIVTLWTFVWGTVGFFATHHRIKADAWEEIVLVDKTIFFWKDWIQQVPLTTWSKWVWRSTDWIKVNVRPAQFEAKFDDIMTSDNTPVDFSAFIKIKAIEWKTPYLYGKYWNDWYKINIEQYFITELRDEIAKFPMTALTTRQELLNDIQKKVKASIMAFVKANNIPVEIQEVIIGKINPPDQIKTQLSETAAQQQRKKTEIEKTWAEIERKNSETKRAEADNAYRNALWLTPDQFLQNESIKAQKEIAKTLAEAKWNVTVIIWWQWVQPVMNIWKK